jgi:hypothetical protein
VLARGSVAPVAAGERASAYGARPSTSGRESKACNMGGMQ